MTTKLNLTALKVFMVIGADGVVDYSKSKDKLSEQLAEYELRQDEGNGLAARAVAEFFDTFKGVRVSTSFVISNCLANLKANPDNYQMLTEACERFIKANTGSENASIFGQKKGVGIWRWTDQPKATEAV